MLRLHNIHHDPRSHSFIHILFFFLSKLFLQELYSAYVFFPYFTFTKSIQNFSRYLPFAQIALNSSYNSSLGSNPHFVLHAYTKRLPWDLPDYISPYVNNVENDHKQKLRMFPLYLLILRMFHIMFILYLNSPLHRPLCNKPPSQHILCKNFPLLLLYLKHVVDWILKL